MNKIAFEPADFFLVNPVNLVEIELSRSVASIHHNPLPRCLAATWPRRVHQNSQVCNAA